MASPPTPDNGPHYRSTGDSPGSNPPEPIRLPSLAALGNGSCQHHHDVDGKIAILSMVANAFSESMGLIEKAGEALKSSVSRPPHDRAVPLSDARNSLRKATDPLLLQKRTAIHFPPGTDVLSCLETACHRLDAHVKQVTELIRAADCVDFAERLEFVREDVSVTKQRISYTQVPVLDAIQLLRLGDSLPESA